MGLLISSLHWYGLKIESQFKNEEPIDLINTPYQHLQHLITQAASRARTVADWNNKHTRGLREIEEEATKISSKLTPEEKGIVRTTISGGGCDKVQVANINEDIERAMEREDESYLES